MRVLFIGGNGNISAACSRLCLQRGMEVFLRALGSYIAAWRKARSAGRQAAE